MRRGSDHRQTKIRDPLRTPPLVTNTLPGLTSRCTIPLACAASRPAAICRPNAMTSSASSVRASGDTGRASRPQQLHDQIVRGGVSPTSYTAQMLGWLSAATARASRSKRARAGGHPTPDGAAEPDGDDAIKTRVERDTPPPCRQLEQSLQFVLGRGVCGVRESRRGRRGL